MSAYLTAATWIVQTLLADPEVVAVVGDRVYEGLAPKSAAHPLITVQPYTDPVDTNFQGGRALTVVDVIVRVWDEQPDSRGSSYKIIRPAGDRIDALLHGRYGITRPDGYVAGSERYSEVAETTLENGRYVRALGGRFYVTVSPLA